MSTPNLTYKRISNESAGTPPYDGGTLFNVSVPTNSVPAYTSKKARKADLLQPAYVALVASTVLSSLQSGSVVHNYTAAGVVQAQLPPAIAPQEFEFTVMTANDFGPVTSGSDVIVSDTFSGGLLTSSVLGSNLKLRCIVNGQWIVAYSTGAWVDPNNGEVVNLQDRQLVCGSILTPVSYIDLILPVGYVKFRLEMHSLALSVEDSIAFAFSFDGTNFLCDNTNVDSYLVSMMQGGINNLSVNGSRGLIGPNMYDDSDALISVDNINSDIGILGMIDLCIIPGSASEYTSGSMSSSSITSDNGYSLNQDYSVWGLNHFAVVPPILARAVKIRILPYGSNNAADNANAPISGHKITSGVYTLWGSINAKV